MKIKENDVVEIKGYDYIAVSDIRANCENCDLFSLDIPCGNLLRKYGYEYPYCEGIIWRRQQNKLISIILKDLENILCNEDTCAFKKSCSNENNCIMKQILNKSSYEG